ACPVTAGATTILPVSLVQAGGGGADVRISGPTTVGVGGSIVLFAAVGDNSGNPVQNPSVSWTSRSPAVADVFGSGDTATVTGHAVGSATIVATTGTLADAITIQVIGAR